MTKNTYEMFDEKVPSDYESGEFTDGHVTVNVRGPGFGYPPGKFGVAQSCEYKNCHNQNNKS